MKFGLFGINSGLFARDPAAALATGRRLEETGWESVWAGEHYVLPPQPRQTQAPSSRTLILDPFVSLAGVAATTTKLLLATGVIVVPLHEPGILAKKVASLDRLSHGRFLFGVGVGYQEEAFAALGVDLAARASRFEDGMAVMRQLWSGEVIDVSTASFTLSGVQARPAPTAPVLPTVYGGYAPISYRRATAAANGWYGFALDPDGTAICMRGLRRAADEVDRPEPLGPLEITVSPPPGLPLTAPTVDAYRQLGVSRLVLIPPPEVFRAQEAMDRYIDDVSIANGLDGDSAV